ncbi:hypothetical protein J6590_087846 [Homalodisca vitripennis]|nr:hypothetical protein J6590_087846 [Homalodisca vitripennis]
MAENETNAIPGNVVIGCGQGKRNERAGRRSRPSWPGSNYRYHRASQTKDQDKIVSCTSINNPGRYLQTFHF